MVTTQELLAVSVTYLLVHGLSHYFIISLNSSQTLKQKLQYYFEIMSVVDSTPFVQLVTDVSKTAFPLLCTSSVQGSSGGRSLTQLEEKSAVHGGVNEM